MNEAETAAGAFAQAETPPSWRADIRLFAFAWAAAFLFVSVWLG
jgi:hypothetical protein